MTAKNKIMMKNLTIFYLAIVSLLACSSFNLPFDKQEISQSQFIGTWTSEEDINLQWEFTDQRLTTRYQGEPETLYTYKVSTESPQCGIEVNTRLGDHYLVMTNMNDPADKTCFLINGFAETTVGRKTFSISPIDKGGFSIFIKQ